MTSVSTTLTTDISTGATVAATENPVTDEITFDSARAKISEGLLELVQLCEDASADEQGRTVFDMPNADIAWNMLLNTIHTQHRRGGVRADGRPFSALVDIVDNMEKQFEELERRGMPISEESVGFYTAAKTRLELWSTLYSALSGVYYYAFGKNFVPTEKIGGKWVPYGSVATPVEANAMTNRLADLRKKFADETKAA